jgi:glycosyltransferase involved in cell wall biosynthesis
LLDNPKALGAALSLNTGFSACDADYAVIHDDDDSWEPEFLEKSINALKLSKKLIPNTRGIICHTTAVVENLEGNYVVEKYRHSWNGWVRAVTLVDVAATNFIPPISFLFETKALSEIGLFNDIKFAEDWEFYLRFLAKFDIAVLPEHLANWHLRPDARDAYGNTIAVERTREHPAIIAALMNDLIRRDFASGKFGLGCLVALTSRGPMTGNFKFRFWVARQRAVARWNPRTLIKRVFKS